MSKKSSQDPVDRKTGNDADRLWRKNTLPVLALALEVILRIAEGGSRAVLREKVVFPLSLHGGTRRGGGSTRPRPTCGGSRRLHARRLFLCLMLSTRVDPTRRPSPCFKRVSERDFASPARSVHRAVVAHSQSTTQARASGPRLGVMFAGCLRRISAGEDLGRGDLPRACFVTEAVARSAGGHR